MSDKDDTGWQSPVYIISGEQAEGKTTFLMDILTKLEVHAIKVRGIIAPGYFKDDVRSGFCVVDVSTGTGVELCSDIPSSGAELHGRYYFRPEGLTFGRRTLLISPDQKTPDLIVIDEVGRFDVRGALWGGCIDQLVKKIHPPMIWTVRNEFVEMVINRWPMIRPVIININSMSTQTCTDNILKEIALFKKPGSN